MLNNKYGHFTEDGKEFVISDPFTPRPWINVISNGDYSLIVTQTGGGYSFRGNAEQNRLTRSFQDIVKDNWGKYFYIRDLENGKTHTSGLLPLKDGVDFYEVRHGLGYTVITRESNKIRSEFKIFVSPDNPMEYMTLELTDLSGKNRKLDVTGYFEWACGMAFDTHREFQRLFYDCAFDKQLNSIVINKCLWGFPDSKGRYNNDDWPYTAFFCCSEKASSFDCDKEKFIGMYRDEKAPAGMESEELTGSCGRYCEPVAALRVKVALKANGAKKLVFGLGMAKKNGEDYKALIKSCTEAKAEEAHKKTVEKWDKICSAEQPETPDKAFDVMVGKWTKYQALSCRMWAKAAYYQISGGIGYRDQLQDSHIGLETDPEITRKQILLHATKQFNQGDVLHWWLTYNGAGPRTKCSDDFLWLPFTVINYLAETADESILAEKAGYLDGGEGDLYDHCKKAIEYSFSMFSPRGIPLMGAHDWNDGLSAVGHGMIGESFWVAEFLYWIITRFDKIAEHRGDKEFAEKLKEKSAKLKEDFNAHAWDGEWFLQATNDLGEKIGSRENTEGRIFLNPQIWAVISDITTEERKKKAMEAVTKYLLRDYGALLLYPEYSTPKSEIGYITRYAPGLRENGGVYTHAATWAVWAYSLLGDNEKAYKAFKGICPPNRGADIDKYMAEPYVLPGNSDGPNSPYFGKGSWSWYSGSAQWLHRVGVQFILGVIPQKDGLRITPCLPEGWSGYAYKRKYRGAEYDITVKKTGKTLLKVDGKVIEGNLIPDLKTGKHTVEAEI